VLGAGSGGMASARRAASYGAKVAIIEKGRLGGTCVNLGCVPKKIMFATAQISEYLHDAEDYGFSQPSHSFNWGKVKEKRDAYIKKLNEIYEDNLKKENVTLIRGEAKFVDRQTIICNNETFTAEHILIASGGRPHIPEINGKEFAHTSDDFFSFTQLPKRAAIIGSGYIAVELAGILNALGTEVHLFIRGPTVLSKFDHMLQEMLTNEYKAAGIQLFHYSQVTALERDQKDKKKIKFNCENYSSF